MSTIQKELKITSSTRTKNNYFVGKIMNKVVVPNAGKRPQYVVKDKKNIAYEK